MEFKGTKGKWFVNRQDDIFIETDDKTEKTSVCLMLANGIYDYDKWRYNALLISKAPEMLEMLKDIKDYLGSDVRMKVDKLIKEATEL